MIFVLSDVGVPFDKVMSIESVYFLSICARVFSFWTLLSRGSLNRVFFTVFINKLDFLLSRLYVVLL